MREYNSYKMEIIWSNLDFKENHQLCFSTNSPNYLLHYFLTGFVLCENVLAAEKLYPVYFLVGTMLLAGYVCVRYFTKYVRDFRFVRTLFCNIGLWLLSAAPKVN